MYPRIKKHSTCSSICIPVFAPEQQAPRKSSSKTTWLQPAAAGGSGQHGPASGTVWGPPASSRGQAGGGSTSSWDLRASSDPRPASMAPGRPFKLGGRSWLSGGSSDNLPGLGGLQGQPKCILRSPRLSQPFSGRSHSE